MRSPPTRRKRGPKKIVVRGASREDAVRYVTSKLEGLKVVDKGSSLYVERDAYRAAKFNIEVSQSQVTFSRAPALTRLQSTLVGLLVLAATVIFLLYATDLVDVIVLFIVCGGIEVAGLLVLLVLIPGLLFGSAVALALGGEGGEGQQQQQQVVVVLPGPPKSP